jgi:hypothetical protein
VARSRYVPEDLGNEVAAPSGYYQPLEESFLDYDGKRVLYILGTACIEASCCGIGNWAYLRVEGYVVEGDSSLGEDNGRYDEIETIEDDNEKTAISRLLLEKHPGARLEFR